MREGRGGRSPIFEEGVSQCGCCSLVSEKAVDDAADLAFAVACRIFTFRLVLVIVLERAFSTP